DGDHIRWRPRKRITLLVQVVCRSEFDAEGVTKCEQLGNAEQSSAGRCATDTLDPRLARDGAGNAGAEDRTIRIGRVNSRQLDFEEAVYSTARREALFEFIEDEELCRDPPRNLIKEIVAARYQRQIGPHGVAVILCMDWVGRSIKQMGEDQC